VKKLTAGQRLVQQLLAEGVTHVFCVPGESYLAALDALSEVADKITTVSCRHEAAAANMAAAHGKLTGRPGICMVTRGPGATHASTGVHTAQQDSAPMILFIGQVARGHRGREAFQEIDFVSMFEPMAKWAAEIVQADRMGEFVERAFNVAIHGRPGPVVLSLPEDMLTEEIAATPVQPSRPAPSDLTPDIVSDIGARLKRAERPILLLGGSNWTEEALTRLSNWCEASALPIALSFRRKDLISNDHPGYAGDIGVGTNPKLVERLRQADLVLMLGARLGEMPSQGYTLFTPEETAQKLIHIYPDGNEIGRVWPFALGAAASNVLAALALSKLSVDGTRWKAWQQTARKDYDDFTAPVTVTGAVNLSQVFHHLEQVMPVDTIVCNGAGNYAAWLHRFYKHRAPFTQLAPTSGAMGFGLPAAIAAKLARPKCEVIAVGGDGCFLMNSQDLATAVQYNVPLIVIVVDNGAYGTIRMHQEREYPTHVIATQLRNPDFVQYAKSFGAWAQLVERTEDFPAALQAARAQPGVALLHLKTSLKDIAPGKQLPI
jgi:acetolactate synthase I/II/III large subunit